MTKKSAAKKPTKKPVLPKKATKVKAPKKACLPQFAVMLRMAREQFGWSLRVLSERLGNEVSRQTAFRAEMGDATLATVIKIGSLLQLNVSDLMLAFNKHQLDKAKAKNKAARQSTK